MIDWLVSMSFELGSLYFVLCGLESAAVRGEVMLTGVSRREVHNEGRIRTASEATD